VGEGEPFSEWVKENHIFLLPVPKMDVVQAAVNSLIAAHISISFSL